MEVPLAHQHPIPELAGLEVEASGWKCRQLGRDIV
jgi:hypothetical protein